MGDLRVFPTTFSIRWARRARGTELQRSLAKFSATSPWASHSPPRLRRAARARCSAFMFILCHAAKNEPRKQISASRNRKFACSRARTSRFARAQTLRAQGCRLWKPLHCRTTTSSVTASPCHLPQRGRLGKNLSFGIYHRARQAGKARVFAFRFAWNFSYHGVW